MKTELEEKRERLERLLKLSCLIGNVAITFSEFEEKQHEKGYQCYILTLFDDKGNYLGVKVGKTEASVYQRAKQIMYQKNNDFIKSVIIEKIFDCPTVDDMYALECVLHKWARQELLLDQRKADYFFGNTVPSETDYKKLDNIAEKLFVLL